jgi:hypothetical protein
MLFCEKARTGKLVPPEETAAPDQIPASGAHRPDTAHSGKIRLGGGCRLPLQGEPMERDRPRRAIQNRGA